MTENINHKPCPFTNCGSSDAFSYNTDGYGRCHSCGQSYPHKGMSVFDWCEETYPTGNKSETPYRGTYTPKGITIVKPQLVETNTTPKYVTYRGITPKTLEFFKAPIYIDKDENVVKTEYVYPDGSVKTRVHPKEFYTSAGFKSDNLFGMNLFPAGSAKAVTITEGECFTPDAEVMTKRGWVKFEDYSGEDVLVVDNGQSAFFEAPLAVVDKAYDGELIEYRSGSYYSLTTPEHNIVRIHPKQGLKKFPAYLNSFFKIPRVFDTKPQLSLPLLDIKIWIMLSADFTFRASGDIYGALKKKRKVNRAKELLDQKGVRYSANEDSRGYTSFFIHRGHGLSAAKELPWSMVFHPNKYEVLQEVIFWDGNYVKGKNQAEFASNLKHNIDVVQALSHSCGYVSTIIHRENDFGKWMKASILFNKKTSDTQRGPKSVYYSGRVMCLTVSTGMLVVRQKGSISISGNCDAMSAYQMLGGYPVVSLPSATPSRKLLENCKDWLNSFEKIYLSLDADNKADKFALALIDLFPGRIYKVGHGSYKDANDFLQAGKVEQYKKSWWGASKYTPENFISSPEQWEKVLTEERPYEYVPTPIDDLNKVVRGFIKGGITILKALPGTGKTDIFRYWQHDLVVNKGARVAVLHMEEMKSTTGRGLVTYHLKKNVRTIEDAQRSGVNEEEVIRTIKGLTADDKFISFEIDPSDPMESVLSCIRTAIAVYNVDFIFIDHLQRLAYLAGVDNATAALTELAVKMVDLTKRKNVGIIAISHVNESGAAKYAKAIEEEAIVILEVERDRFSNDAIARNTTVITVSKNRPFSILGDGGKMYYDPETTTIGEPVDTW